jgi:hypothetical protein
VKQRVVENLPQSSQGIAHRRLAQPDTRRRAANTLFFQQGLERQEKIQVYRGNIHGIDNTFF